MRHTIACLAALVLGIGANAARADNERGFYVGAGLGQFNVEVDDVNSAINVAEEFDEDDTSWKLFAGWRFAPFFSIELDYIDFGGPESNGTSVNVDGIAPYLVGTLPLGIFELSAQVGYYFYDVTVEDNRPQTLDVDSSDENLVYGAGVGLILFEHLEAKLMYEIIDLEDVGDSETDSDALWLTAAWRF
jgi:opacity protein-like surface antigen